MEAYIETQFGGAKTNPVEIDDWIAGDKATVLKWTVSKFNLQVADDGVYLVGDICGVIGKAKIGEQQVLVCIPNTKTHSFTPEEIAEALRTKGF